VAVRIRMKKMGRTHRPFFRICAMDARTPRDGKAIEELGYYDPLVRDTDARCVLKVDRVDYWLSVGAKPTPKVGTLIKKYGAGGTHLEAQQKALENLSAHKGAASTAAVEAARAAAEKESKAREEAEKKKAEEAKAAAEAEAKAKAEQEAKAKAEQEAKARQEAEKKDESSEPEAEQSEAARGEAADKPAEAAAEDTPAEDKKEDEKSE